MSKVLKVVGPGSFDNSFKKKWIITEDGKILLGKPKGYRTTGTAITYHSEAAATKALNKMQEKPKVENKIWSTKELQKDFQVVAFAAPYVVVIHRETGIKGTLQFDHAPRIYYNFQEDK